MVRTGEMRQSFTRASMPRFFINLVSNVLVHLAAEKGSMRREGDTYVQVSLAAGIYAFPYKAIWLNA